MSKKECDCCDGPLDPDNTSGLCFDCRMFDFEEEERKRKADEKIIKNWERRHKL